MSLISILKRITGKEREVHVDFNNLEDMHQLIKDRYYDYVIKARDKRFNDIAEFHNRTYGYRLSLEKCIKKIRIYIINKENSSYNKRLLSLNNIKYPIDMAIKFSEENKFFDKDYHKLVDMKKMVCESIDNINTILSRTIE